MLKLEACPPRSASEATRVVKFLAIPMTTEFNLAGQQGQKRALNSDEPPRIGPVGVESAVEPA